MEMQTGANGGGQLILFTTLAPDVQVHSRCCGVGPLVTPLPPQGAGTYISERFFKDLKLLLNFMSK